MCLIVKKSSEKASTEEIIKKLKEIIVPEVATEDIPVAKLLFKNPEGKFLPLSFAKKDFFYEVGETYEEKEFLSKDLEGMAGRIAYRLKEANAPIRGMAYNVHPMEMMMMQLIARMGEAKPITIDDLLHGAAEEFEINYGFHSWKQASNQHLNRCEIYCNFTIPKDSLYFKGSNNGRDVDMCYCSNKIRFDSIIASVK